MSSQAEDTLAFQLYAAGVAPPEREYAFAKALKRRWRADFAWPEAYLLVEVEGGLYMRGRHVRPRGYENDMAKYNAAVQLGWRLLRFSPRQVMSGEALAQVQQALGVMV